jgi:uncharacterized protein
MTILIVPNLNCNLRCGYCFGHGYKWNKNAGYNIEAILSSMQIMHQQTGGDSLCLHGGESTLIDRKDFEAILKKMFELQGKSSIQTNCYKLDDELINLFKKYKTSVGVSLDGDRGLNAIRGFPGDKKKSLEYTNQVLNNLFRLHKEGVSVGIITVLTKINASSNAKLRKLLKFVLMLREHGIKGGRLNLMWSNYSETSKYELTPEEASRAWLYLYKNIKQYADLQWQPFREFTDNLLGFGHASCSFGKCDYFCTSTKVILPDGSLGNCDRTHQEGSTYTRATMSYERYEVLKATDCLTCKFWDICYGGCPSEGFDGDWRNKTRFCQPIYDLYTAIETDIKTMLPNVRLMSQYKGPEDYFDAIKKGIKNEPFQKMCWVTAKKPSVWKSVELRDKPANKNKITDNQLTLNKNKNCTNQRGEENARN